jgi:hypothetical protein
MKKIRYKLRIAVLIVLATGGVIWVAVAIEHRHTSRVILPKKQIIKEPEITYDSVLLRKFTSTIRSLDFNRRNCAYAGMINLDDPNDTTNTVHHLNFRFCRVAGDYYYRLGNTEMIHKGKLDLYVENDQRKVVISSRPIEIQAPVQDFNLMVKTLRSESYALTGSVKGGKQKLSLINEHHFSCKELSVTLDTASGQLERIYSRMTDIGSPMDKGKERTLDVQLLEISGHADRHLYPETGDVVRMKDGKWTLTGKYSTYELIML